jgi:hypothetical protein
MRELRNRTAANTTAVNNYTRQVTELRAQLQTAETRLESALAETKILDQHMVELMMTGGIRVPITADVPMPVSSPSPNTSRPAPPMPQTPTEISALACSMMLSDLPPSRSGGTLPLPQTPYGITTAVMLSRARGTA